jgi:hypothetical protein
VSELIAAVVALLGTPDDEYLQADIADIAQHGAVTFVTPGEAESLYCAHQSTILELARVYRCRPSGLFAVECVCQLINEVK